MRGVRTGDRGRLDDDGFLFITGRFKEEYKLANGKYIHPETIELEMKVLPWILNAVVTGAGHEYNVALIVPDLKLLEHLAAGMKLSVDPKDLLILPIPPASNLKNCLPLRSKIILRKHWVPTKFPAKV